MEFFHQTTSYDSEEFPVAALRIHDLEFSSHWHADAEFILVRSGNIGATVNKVYKALGPGAVVACGSRDIHSYRRLSVRTESIVILFKPEVINLPSSWPVQGHLATNFALKSQHLEYSQKFERAALSLVDEMTAKRPRYEAVCRGILLELCGLTERELSVDTSTEGREESLSETLKRMQGALEYIQQNSQYPIALKDVAEAASLSEWYFSRTFKKLVGTSFRGYVNEVRIARAEQLMASTKKNLADIALECGFDSVRTFNRVFQAVRAKTPSEARAELT
jgi:AraC-like DNA-binding protein